MNYLVYKMSKNDVVVVEVVADYFPDDQLIN